MSNDNASLPPAVSRPITFADVAMRFVHDLPGLAVIVVVGLLALHGTAEARDAVVTGLGVLLARSYPSKISQAARGVLMLCIGGLVAVKIVACAPSQTAKEAAAEATYAAEHLACVERFDTTPKINACRADVRKRWQITETRTKDASAER